MRQLLGRSVPIIAGLLGIGGLAGCSAGSSSSAASSPGLPAATASSQQVVSSYLAAAKAGDCDLTRQLTSASTWAWCDAPRLTGYTEPGEPTRLPASQAGVALDCYHLTITATAAPKRGITAGTRPWTLCFQHTDGGYRLYQQGLR